MFSVKNGIFQGIIRDIYNNNNLDKVIISISGQNNPNYPKESIVNFTGVYYQSEQAEKGQWISIELKDRWVSLTHFALSSPRNGYPISFDFEASTDGEDWKLLYSQRNSTALEGGKNIFKTDKEIVARFFRWTNKGPSAHEYQNINYINRFRVKRVDLYGAITPCFTDCNTTVPAFRQIPIFCSTIKADQRFTGCFISLIYSIFTQY